MTTQTQTDQLQAAVDCYNRRQERREHPDGEFDKAGRWNESDTEHRDCCNKIRYPSRSYPYSRMVHCRTAEHIAHLYDVDARALKAAVRAAKPALREGGDTYYKQVALVDGRLLSIFDGETEYRLGETISENARQHHEGGIYVYRSADAAKRAPFPRESALLSAERVLIRVRAEGRYCRYDNGKLSFSRVTPLEVI